MPSARISDEDSDATVAELAPQPFIVGQAGQANLDRIFALQWPEGEEVTIFIDEDNDPNNGYLYTDKKISEMLPLGIPGVLFEIGLEDPPFDLQEGYFLIASGADTVKVLELTHIEITDVDVDTEIVTGTADPGDKVTVFVVLPVNGGFQIVGRSEEETDGAGYWSTDFSVNGIDIQLISDFNRLNSLDRIFEDNRSIKWKFD